MAAGRKTKAGVTAGILAAALCVWLCGCSQASLLSQREIVHGVFFQLDGEEHTAVLLLADQPEGTEGNDAGYKTAVGTGGTPAQALEQAESSLDGQVFYGLMDLAVLPGEGSWETTISMGRLLYEKTQPAPQFTLLLMRNQSGREWTEDAADLYEKMESALAKYGIRNGLQLLFSAQNECALPLWQGTGYGFVFLQKDRPNIVLEEELSAQLAAVLCGQADRLSCSFSRGTAAVESKVMVQHRVQEQGNATFYLTLEDPELQELSTAGREEETLKQELSAALEEAFGQITAQSCAPGFDPLRISVWVWAARGSVNLLPPLQLQVAFEA